MVTNLNLNLMVLETTMTGLMRVSPGVSYSVQDTVARCMTCKKMRHERNWSQPEHN